MHHVVLGAGEVGTAVAEVLRQKHLAALRDVEARDFQGDVLDVCIPWQDDFVDQVHRYAEIHGVSLVVVHSTVPVGTCDAEGWVHSPVRGRHPHLAEGVATFTKHFGGERAAEAAQDWKELGVSVHEHHRASETEAGKLWELVQFGITVQVEKAIHEWCTKREIDPEMVYRNFAATYNAGYASLGEHRFIRPILDHVPGPIGGHCVVPMSHLLDHPLAEMVREGFA